MELDRIIEILEKHQEWRRDQNVPPKTEMQNPVEIGTAIDYALSELKKLRLGYVSQQRELLIDFTVDLFDWQHGDTKQEEKIVDNYLNKKSINCG